MTDSGSEDNGGDAHRMLEIERDRLTCQLIDARAENEELKGYTTRLERRLVRLREKKKDLETEVEDLRAGVQEDHPQRGWTEARSPLDDTTEESESYSEDPAPAAARPTQARRLQQQRERR